MFDLLSHNRTSLSFHTELLEACGWDEELMEKVLKATSEVLEEIRLPDIPCPLDVYLEKVLRPALLKENLYENQINVIIKFIRHDAKFVQWMMSAEEV